MEKVIDSGFKLNWKRTFIIGLAFFGILLLWQVYDSWCPTFLTELFIETIPGIQEESEVEVQFFVGLMMALDNLVALIMLPIFGRLSDKTKTPIGKRMPFILIGTLVSAMAFPFIPVLFHYHNLAGVISLMAIVIFFMMMYRSPAVALMPDITPKPLRAKANGIINIMGYLGGACATILGLFLVLSDYLNVPGSWAYGNIWAIELPFLLASILMVITCLILFFSIRENKVLKEVEGELKRGEEVSEVIDEVKDDKPLSRANKVMLLLILIAEVFWFMADNGLSTYISNYTIYYLHSASSNVMIMTIVGGVFSVIGFALGGLIADKIGRKYTIISGLAIYLIGIFIMCFAFPNEVPAGEDYAPFPYLFYIVFIFKGFGIALVNTCSFPMVVELCNRDKIGAYTGYYYAASMGAQTLTPIILGALLSFVGVWWLLPIYCTIAIAISLIVFLFVKNVRHSSPSKKGLEAMDEI